MKLTVGLSAVFAGAATAAQQAGQVYILSKPETDSTPSIPSNIAQLILQQRLNPLTQQLSTDLITNGDDVERTLELLNTYGRAPPPLFASSKSSGKQLFVVVEDVADNLLAKTGGTHPSFKVGYSS